MALLKRAMADIPRIEQLEKDHPRMARLFQKGLLPFCVWEQLLEAETLMDQEVNSVQAEAERMRKPNVALVARLLLASLSAGVFAVLTGLASATRRWTPRRCRCRRLRRPSISIPREKLVTSSSVTALVSPPRMEACTAAPMATTSSG